MKLQEAISILKIHQQWRLGADIVMIEPKELTKAIDVLINYHIDIMNETLSSQTEISDESWEGCDGCTEQDKYFWTKGYQAGYNRATPTEISDDRTKLHWKTSLVVHTPEISDEEITKLANEYILYNDSKRQWVIEGMKLYREQLKLK